jgi:hypothetical protein
MPKGLLGPVSRVLTKKREYPIMRSRVLFEGFGFLRYYGLMCSWTLKKEAHAVLWEGRIIECSAVSVVEGSVVGPYTLRPSTP